MLMGLLALSYLIFHSNDRHLFLKFDSGHGHGYLYYDNGLWTRYLPLERKYEVTLYYADLSPDGSRIAFKKDSFLYIYDLKSNEIVHLNAEENYPSNNTRVQWSPDGSKIGLPCNLEYDAPIEVCAWDVAKGEMQILSDLHAYKKYDSISFGNYLFFGGWSADAKTVAFIVSFPEDDSGSTLQRILTLDIDTGKATEVLDSQESGLSLYDDIALSPDGKKILFSGNTLLEEQENDYTAALYQINSDGSGLQRLVNYKNWLLFQPVWSPDGSSFYVNASNYYQVIPFRYDGSGRLIGMLPFQFGKSILAWRSSEFGK